MTPHRIADEPWDGTWAEDDPHANLKREVADYTRADPLATLEVLAELTGIPVEVLVRYVLVKWTAEGSEALLALGPRTVERLWAVIAGADDEGTDAARLEAYDALRQMVAWLRAPLEEEGPNQP
jgi:hypothetical protein